MTGKVKRLNPSGMLVPDDEPKFEDDLELVLEFANMELSPLLLMVNHRPHYYGDHAKYINKIKQAISRLENELEWNRETQNQANT